MLSDARLAELIEEVRRCYDIAGETGSVPGVRLNSLIGNALTELKEARKLLRTALPHIRTCPGPTHHEDCACQVKRRIEAMGKGDGK